MDFFTWSKSLFHSSALSAAIRRIIIGALSLFPGSLCAALFIRGRSLPPGCLPLCLSPSAGVRTIPIRSLKWEQILSGTASMMSTATAARWTSPAPPCPCRRSRPRPHPGARLWREARPLWESWRPPGRTILGRHDRFLYAASSVESLLATSRN